jgi:hypothetical protein
VIVAVLLSLGLFWMRWFVSLQRDLSLPRVARQVTIRLSPRLFGSQGKDDPNLLVPPQVVGEAQIIFPFLFGLGAQHYLEARMPGGPNSYVYRWEPKPDGTRHYYDPSLGLIVYETTQKVRDDDGTYALRPLAHYAGPEGVGETPDEKLGRFMSPIADTFWLSPQVVYDRTLRRFFAIDRSNRTVRKGPELADTDSHKPVQIRALSRNSFVVSAKVWPSRQGDDPSQNRIYWESLLLPTDRLLVLDASGRIDLVDQQTLEYVGVAGWLSTPPTLFNSTLLARLDDIAAYDVKPFFVLRHGASGGRSYGGCAVASLSREGIAMQLDVYDPNGRRIVSGGTEVQQYVKAGPGAMRVSSIPSARAAYFYLPSAQVLTIAKFTLENLHPPALLLLSYLAAPHLDATAGYRSVFLLPDSFVAMSARDAGAGVIERPFRALFLAFPALLLAMQLACQVTRDGRRMGLSKNARAAWGAGTLLFGLPAYITYRLTRPKATLVTCGNCGLGRRPDMDKCHQCGSSWVVPELTPPAWRVLGEQEQAEESSLSQAQQADSSAQ